MSLPEELAALTVEWAMKKGAEQAEAWCLRRKRIAVDIEGSRIRSCTSGQDDGIRCHAYFRGGRGAASAMGAEAGSARIAAEWAVENALNTGADPDFKGLAPPSEAPEVGGLYDPAVEALEAGELVELAVRALDSAREADPGAILEGGSGSSAQDFAFANSLGSAFSERQTSVSFSALAVVKRPGGDIGSFYDYRYSRNLADFDPAGVSRSATVQASRFLVARPVRTGRMDLVLGPIASHFLLSFAVCGRLDAEDVQRKRSYFAGRKGTRIGPEFLTLTDDPLVPGGANSRRADAEGVPSRRLVLVKEGILQTWLHNTYTANKAGEANTGHASFEGYGRSPSLSPTNILPTLGRKTAAEIVRETSDGIYVDFGFLEPNPASGDLSGGVDFGMKIEGGALAHPVRNALVGTTIFELLARLDEISSDCRRDDPGTIMPTLRIRDVLVAGR